MAREFTARDGGQRDQFRAPFQRALYVHIRTWQDGSQPDEYAGVFLKAYAHARGETLTAESEALRQERERERALARIYAVLPIVANGDNLIIISSRPPSPTTARRLAHHHGPELSPPLSSDDAAADRESKTDKDYRRELEAVD